MVEAAGIDQVRTERDRLLAAVQSMAADVIASRDWIERERRLPDELVATMKAAGIFRMPMPAAWGGPELDPISQFDVLEALARLDPSVGWVAMIGSDGGYYSARLEDSAARSLWTDLDMVTAGWLFPGGTATPADGGFRVSGRWQFGNASLHADVIVGGVLLFEEDGFPRMTPEGVPEYLVACVPAADATRVDTWYTTGLAGSGSNDYTLDDVFVPAARVWTWGTPPRRPGPLYAFEYMFFGNISAVPLGAARAAIDELTRLAQTKVVMPTGSPWSHEARVQTAIAQCEVIVSSARAWAIEVLGDVWATVCRGEATDARQRALFRLSVMHSFRAAHQAVSLAYETAGTSAIYRPSLLDRLLRDVATMGQHVLGSSKTLEPAGRVLLGLPPDAPIF